MTTRPRPQQSFHLSFMAFMEPNNNTSVAPVEATVEATVETTVEAINYNEKYNELLALHEMHLKDKGVKLPRLNTTLGFSLAILYAHKNQFVHIQFIQQELTKHNFKLTGTDPVQVRHLSTQKGWWITKQGKYEHQLVSDTQPLPGFIPEKRSSKLNEENWLTMKKEYGHACVNCGSKEGEPLRWDQTKSTVLQQGHMDPRKDLTYDNCIPQCAFCNQQYKSKAIFNKRGFVIDFCKSGF